MFIKIYIGGRPDPIVWYASTADGRGCLERRVLVALERRTREQRGLRQREVPESSPGADVGGVSPRPGADVGGGEPSQSPQMVPMTKPTKVNPSANPNNDSRQLLITKPRE